DYVFDRMRLVENETMTEETEVIRKNMLRSPQGMIRDVHPEDIDYLLDCLEPSEKLQHLIEAGSPSELTNRLNYIHARKNCYYNDLLYFLRIDPDYITPQQYHRFYMIIKKLLNTDTQLDHQPLPQNI